MQMLDTFEAKFVTNFISFLGDILKPQSIK